MVEKKCIICGKMNVEGILIKDEHICCECETRIVNCDLSDDEYEVYLNIIKKEIIEKHLEKYI
ncbi:MAG: sigma factor G inhibitor Gin [Clostridium sp.]